MPAVESIVPAAPAEPEAISGPLLRAVLIAAFGSVLLNLSSTSVNVAIDGLMKTFDAPLAQVQWVVTGYLLTLTLVLPAFRWAVEKLGSRRLYVACLLTFTATSVLSACAWSLSSLIAFRLVQGAVGGLLAPLTQTLIAQLAGPKRMGRAVSLMSVPALVAPIIGPTVGGLLMLHLSWRWLFLINLPFGLAGAWLAQRYLPSGETTGRTKLDLKGIALLSPGIALLTYAVSSVRSNAAFSLGAVLPLLLAVGLIAVFVLDARRRPATALLDLRLFTQHPAIGASLVCYILTAFGSFGAQLLLPLYYQQVRGESALTAGMMMACQGLGMLLTLPQVGKLTDRYDPGKIVVAGVLTTLLGTFAFTQVTADSSYLLLCLSLVVRGAGLGATNTPALAAAYRNLSRDEVPNATTTMNIVQRMGAPLGTALMAVTLQHFLAGVAPADHSAMAAGFAHTFALSAALSAPALFAGFALMRSSPVSKGK